MRANPHSLFASLFLTFSLFGLSPVMAATDFYSTGPGLGSPDTMCDVWQGVYDAWGLSAAGDEDKDGSTNFVESVAGTDPRNPNDSIKVGNTTIAGNTITFTFDAEAGKKYRILSDATSPTGAFGTVETQIAPVNGATQFIPTADNASQTITVLRVGTSKFYQLETTEADTDGDGVSDWAEGELGSNPIVAENSGAGYNYADTLHSMMSLVATPTTPTGYERNDKTLGAGAVAVPAKIGLTRTWPPVGSPVPVMALPGIVMTGAGGAVDVTKSNAGAGDYAALGTVNIPAGAAAAGGAPYEVNVTPVQDAADEVPEYVEVTFNLPGASGVDGPSATVSIGDADPANDNNTQLYVAYLGREAGVTSTASGYATALVNGDHTSASISVTFNNLSSEQNTAYIRSGPSNDLAPQLPLGQVSGFNYNVAYKPGFYNTDQAFLTALNSGGIWCAISTANYSDKEIAGQFQKANGTTTFDENRPDLVAPTGSWQNPTGAELEREIWRFLSQCTWGGTQALYDEVLAEVNAAPVGPTQYITGLSNWLDKQMNPALKPSVNYRTLVMAADNEEFLLRGNKPSTYGSDPMINGATYAVTFDAAGNPIIGTTADNNRIGNNYPQSGPNRRREWWTMILQCKDQVRQRYTQALSEITIISEADQTTLDRHLGCANYWDMIAANAFGKYRTLLEKVTYSPMMGIYLSHMSNRATYDAGGGLIVSPDENYAREIMQLFSIGLILRHPDGSLVLNIDGLPLPTYDNNDITELARVMTGWSHGARHAVGYQSTWSGTSLSFNNASAQRISDLVLINGSSATNSWFGRDDGHLYWAAPWIYPMRLVGKNSSTIYHDFGAKTLLAGKSGEYVIPAQTVLVGDTDASADAKAATDMTLAHNVLAGDPTSNTAYNGHQNTPVNMSRWLIQRLVTSNPSAGYIYRVQKAYRDTNGNLGAVLKAILLDYEARSLQLADSSISHGKVKEPLVAFASMLRSLKAFSGAPLSTLKDNPPPFSGTDTPLPGPYPQSEYDKLDTANNNPPSLPAGWATGPFRYRFGDLTGNIGQSPQRPPSVFNWFLPDYIVPGPMAEAGLFAPELQISTESSEVAKANFFYAYTWSNLTGMSAQPGADSNVSDFLLTNNFATPAVRFSLDGGATFVNSLTFDAGNYATPQTLTVVGANTNGILNLDNSLLRFNITGAGSGYDGLAAQPVAIGFTNDEQPNEGILALHTGFSTWVQESGKTDTVTVRLASPPPSGSTVTVNVATTSSQVTASPLTLNFTDTNWNTNQTVTVTAVADAVAELPSAANDTLTFTSDSLVGAYDNLSVNVPVGVVDSSSGTNAFDVLITETGGNTVVTESAATAVAADVVDSYTIVLTKQPSANVVVTCSLSNTQTQLNSSGTTFATAGTAVTRTFTATTGQAVSGSTSGWNVPQTVLVRGNVDSNGDASYPTNPLHNTVIVHSVAATGGYAATSALQPVVAAINDGPDTNDARIILTHVGNGETRVVEGGDVSAGLTDSRNDSITVALRTAPAANVTVNLGSNSLVCSPTNLVFTPANFATPQPVIVSAVDDFTNEGVQRVLFPPGNAPRSATATATLTSGAVSAVNITHPGFGYAFPPAVTFTASPGTTATGFATISPHTGELTSIVIANAGSGYVTAPTVTIGVAQNAQTLITASATSVTSEGNYNNYWGNNPAATFTVLNATILDNDATGLVVTPSGGSTIVSEAGATDDFTVSLAQQPASNVTVTFTPSAQATVSPLTLTFTPANWSSGQSVTVSAISDTTVEGDASTTIGVLVDSADKAYDGVKAKALGVTVIDNDAATITYAHSNGMTVVAEAGAAGNSDGTTVRISDTFTVALPKAPTANVTVSLVSDSSQITLSPSLLTFTPTNSTTTQTVTVTAFDDGVGETAIHTTPVRFSTSSADPYYNNVPHLPLPVMVRDNDANGVAVVERDGSTTPTEGGQDFYSVVLTKQPLTNVIIDLVSNSLTEQTMSATSLTFTNTNWNTPQTATINAIGDMINEGREVHTISTNVRTTGSDAAYVGLSGAVVNSYIIDNHRRNENLLIVPSGGSIVSGGTAPVNGNTWVTEGDPTTDSLEIYLASPPQIPVTVTLDANAQMGFSQSVFYFTTANWNVPQTLVVSAIDDAVNDTAAAVAQSQNIQFRCFGDPTYNGIAPTHGVNIIDNDSPGVSIVQSGGITNTTEGGATDTYTVVLTKVPNNNVVITATPASGATINGSTSAINLTFTTANWNTPQTVTVLATNDTTVEGNHQANITHAINLTVGQTTDTSGYAAVNSSGVSTLSLQTVVNNIDDNDNRVIVTQTGLDTRVHEDSTLGIGDTYNVVLRSAPATNVTVTPTVPANQGLTISPASLVFTNANWATPQSFTLGSVDNGINTERARTVTVTHALTGDATFISGQSVHSVGVNMLAKDNVRVLCVATSSINEGGNTGSPTLALNRAPTADVTLTFTSDAQQQIISGLATTTPTQTLVFTTANWMNHQTITLRAVDDSVVEPTPHLGVTTVTAASADPAYNNVPVGNVTCMITDNEVPAVRVIPSGGSTSISEAGAIDTYDIVLSQAPTADVTINITPDAQSAVSAPSVTFGTGNWSTPQTITVSAVNDGTAENTHSTTITHSAAVSTDANFSGLPVPLLTGSVIDNDGAQLVVNQSGGTTTVVEGGANDTIQLSLSTPPTGTVTVTLIPPMSIIPVPPYAKQYGYYTTDLGGSNQQKDRIVADYTEIILLYRDTFYNSLETIYGTGNIPALPSDANLQNAHWAACKAIVDKMDLWWCQGSLKARYPDATHLIQPNQPPPPNPQLAINPRQVILDCLYQINGGANSLGTTRYLPEIVFDPKVPPTGAFHDEIRDRARWAGYLMSTVMPGFVSH